MEHCLEKILRLMLNQMVRALEKALDLLRLKEELKNYQKTSP